jgi:ABC-type branched-subunit amino acid transport system ATPase component
LFKSDPGAPDSPVTVEEAVSGQIPFNEEIIEPNLVHHNVRLGIGYVPQSQNIFPSLSVEKV